MKNILAELVKVKQSPDGQTEVLVRFADDDGTWEKSYSYFSKEVIRFNHLKDRVQEDIRRDFKASKTLDEIKTKIGQTWTIRLDK